MIFWASTETYKDAYPALRKVRLYIEPYLNKAFEKSSLSKLDCKLRYIPIIMPDDLIDDYPERSKLRKKQKIYDCAPQLDYDVFVDGSFEKQLYEYISGITPSAPHLAGLGATEAQIQEFKEIMGNAVENILTEYREKEE